MKQLTLFILASVFTLNITHAQYSRYVVLLQDKGATSYTLANPLNYLSQRAIDRRIRYQIPIDSSDLPVPAAYLSQIQSIPNLSLLNTSRWLNAVSIQTTDPAALLALQALPFVKSVAPIAGKNTGRSKDPELEEPERLRRNAGRPGNLTADYFDYGNNSFQEIHLHQGEFLHNIGLQGQGMQIAMLDGGFFNYSTLKAFDSININGQVLGSWDFVAGNASVVEDNSHGMMCLSTIAANIPGQFIGKAPKAQFYLYRTEDVSSEYPIEEFNWAAGAERADSSGADIISSSLGYGYEFNSPVPDYPYSTLNGDLTISARAADFAASKGLLVFNSAGNSGNDYWRMIVTPADGDSVVAVGAVNTDGDVGTFSSYGPSADGRIKPDLASVGVSAMVQTTSNTIGLANGTSFACPNLAGMGTCLWQGFPEFNNMRIVRALKEAGSIYTNPNDRIGYGIPDMKKAFHSLLIDYATSSMTIANCKASIEWSSKDMAAMKYEIERKGPGETSFTKIGEVKAKGTAELSNQHYTYTDALDGISAGTVSYRIRQLTDTINASAAYIDTTQVALSVDCIPTAGRVLRIFPSPSVGNLQTDLYITTPAAIANLVVMVYNMRGELVIRVNGSKPAGLYVMNLPSAKLLPGKYILKAYDVKREIGKADLLKL